jgi:hypothetical protein
MIDGLTFSVNFVEPPSDFQVYYSYRGVSTPKRISVSSSIHHKIKTSGKYNIQRPGSTKNSPKSKFIQSAKKNCLLILLFKIGVLN